MPDTAISGVAAPCLRMACISRVSVLVAFAAISCLFTPPMTLAQNSKTPAVLPAPSSGKAIVCIYRPGNFVGSAAHDELYVNGTHLGQLLNGEYMFTEVPPGEVIISGLAKVYYGEVIMSAAAALNQAMQKENQRARFVADPGQTYYFKWSSAPLASSVRVTPVEPGKGAKEMSKLHLSKPPDDKDAKQEAKDADKPAAK